MLTFDTKTLPETYTFDGKEYRKTGEADVSEQENGSVIFGHYEGEEITDSDGSTKKPILGILGQNGGVMAPEDCSNLFTNWRWVSAAQMDMPYLPQYIDVTNLDTSNTTNMENLFSSENSAVVVGYENFNTSKVINMRGLFYNRSEIKSLNVSKWDTKNVTDMASMFGGCSGITSLDLSSFNTSNVTDMYGMFHSCSSLTSLDLSSFYTSNVTNMLQMFYGCSNLISLDLTSFDTSKVTDMSNMFSSCSNLISLDLTSFDTRNVTTSYGILSVKDYTTDSHKLTSVSVGCNWTIPKDILPSSVTDYTKVCNE